MGESRRAKCMCLTCATRYAHTMHTHAHTMHTQCTHMHTQCTHNAHTCTAQQEIAREKEGRIQPHAQTHSHTHTQTRTHAHTHTYTRQNINESKICEVACLRSLHFSPSPAEFVGNKSDLAVPVMKIVKRRERECVCVRMCACVRERVCVCEDASTA